MTKKYSIVITVLFCLFIGGISLVSLLLPDVSFSPLENRYLQSPPKLSLETLQNGTFSLAEFVRQSSLPMLPSTLIRLGIMAAGYFLFYFLFIAFYF